MGSAALLLTVSRLAKAHDGHGLEVQTDRLLIESGPGQLVKAKFAHHHHILEVPLNLIQSPPSQGVTLHTGWAQFQNSLASFGKHYHSVILTSEQLAKVFGGEQIVVEDTVKDHQYTIRLS